MNLGNNKLIRIVVNRLLNISTDKENVEFDSWINKDTRNKDLYDRIIGEKRFTNNFNTYTNIDENKAWEAYKGKYASKENKVFKSILKIASVIIILVGILIPRLTSVDDLKDSIILPKDAMATLIESDGSIKELVNTKMECSISAKNNVEEEVESIKYNEIITPKGGEFLLVMEDGSKVWLNASTRIKYPTSFDKKRREVYLEGEAYFEISKDTNRPFFVNLNNGASIEVLGTSFNVSSYNFNANIETVLEKGKVSINLLGSKLGLNPGELGIMDIRTNAISKKKVDTELYTDWRKGNYAFCNESVDNIFKRLSLWYDINVEYKDECVKEILFSGSIKKYDNIYPLLSAMEISGGIKFDIRDKKIIVSMNKIKQ